MKILRIILWVPLIVLSGAMPLMAQQNYLDISRSDDTGDGTSWATAYKSLSNAMSRMPAAGVTNLWVAKGTYIVANVEIATNALFGGYPTGGGSRDWTNNQTIFDGNFTNRCLQKAVAGPVILDGFIVRNGTNTSHGGGLYCTAGSLLIQNCHFTNNIVSLTAQARHGAAVYSTATSNTFINCLFYTNVVGPQASCGGAVYLGAGVHRLDSCIFSNNIATDYGGALYTAGDLTVSNCEFTANTGGNSYRGGGGIAFKSTSGTSMVFNTSFTRNNSLGGNGGGGAINVVQNTASYRPLIIFNGCQFYANTAPLGGAISQADQGAIYYSMVQCVNCTFSNNTGRAMYTTAGEINLSGCVFIRNPAGAVYIAGGCMASNCSFVSNTVSSGGACSLGAASTNIFVNCTFFTNRASSGTGGAIYSSSAGNLMAVTNCIFWGNTSSGTGTNIQNAGTLNIAYSLIGTNANQVNGGTKNFGNGIINANPLFASIVEPFDMHLQSQYGRWTSGGWTTDASTSPAIDAGDPAMNLALEPQPNGGRINMGAYGNTVQASKSSVSGMHVVNDYATNVTASSVTLCGRVLTTNEATATVYIFYGETDAYSNKAAWGFFATNGIVTGVAGFTTTVAVTAGKLYYWRCYVSNDTFTAWAQASNSFLTTDITVQASDNGAAEGGNTGAFTISRPSGTEGTTLSVNYQMSGTAVNGTDYQLLSSNVVMDAGALSTTILVTAYIDLFNQQYEADESVVLTLTTGTYLIGAQSNATVTITNDSTIGLCYVDTSVPDDTGNGLSWATACQSISNGIQRAGYGQIWVAKGTYIVANVDIKTNSLYGGYPTGGGTRDWANNISILDANYTNRALRKATGSEGSVIDGFTIRNGTNTSYSGGFYGSAGSIILNNCTFTNNINSANGGAIYMNVTGVTNVFSNCLFIANSTTPNASYHGAGVYSVACINMFRNCSFITNFAAGSGAVGGAIFDGAGATLIISGCLFTNNWSGGSGGAVYSQGSIDMSGGGNLFYANISKGAHGGAIYNTRANATNVFSNSVFIANSSGGGAAYHGGAIYIANGCLNSFYGCAFVSNVAPYSTGAGGAILENGVGGVLNLYNCAFTNNLGGNAGAIYSQGNRIYAFNTVFFGNRAANTLGGAVQQVRTGSTNVFLNCSFVTNYAKTSGGALSFNNANTSSFINCTFFTNQALAAGGAIHCNAASVLGVTNSIFWKNMAVTTGTNIQNQSGGINSISYCNMNTNNGWISSGTVVSDGGMLNTDPLFVSEVYPYDIHEKSLYGHYSNGSWVADSSMSQCIDAGVPYDAAVPESFYANEPLGNGARINIGCYGNTIEASRSSLPSITGTMIVIE